MKKNLLYIATLSMVLFFTACGVESSKVENNGNSEAENVLSDRDRAETNSTNNLINEEKEVTMKVGVSYSIEIGKSIEKVSDSPKIELRTDLQTGKTTAILLEGEAKIKEGSLTPNI